MAREKLSGEQVMKTERLGNSTCYFCKLFLISPDELSTCIGLVCDVSPQWSKTNGTNRIKQVVIYNLKKYANMYVPILRHFCCSTCVLGFSFKSERRPGDRKAGAYADLGKEIPGSRESKWYCQNAFMKRSFETSDEWFLIIQKKMAISILLVFYNGIVIFTVHYVCSTNSTIVFLMSPCLQMSLTDAGRQKTRFGRNV